MKIVNICMSAPFAEGYSYQDSMLSDYQQRLGHDVTVITGLRTRDSSGKVVQTEPCDRQLNNGVRLIRLAPKGLGKAARNILGIYPDIPKTLRRLEPDFIMVHGLGTHAAGYAAAYKKKNPKTVIVADNHQDEGNTNDYSIILKCIKCYFQYRWKKWIGAVDRVYGVTNWRKEFAHSYYGISDDKLDTLVMGIDDADVNLAMDANNREDIRREYGIPEDAFVFVSGGKLNRKREILCMLRVFGQIQGNQLRFLVFGSIDDEIKDEFNLLVEQDHRIHYIGYIPSDKTNKVLGAADFGLFFGAHSVLWEQAVGCGLPCLFRKHGERSHLDVGGNCIQMDHIDHAVIEATMRDVAFDSLYYKKMKTAASEGAHQFAYSNIAKRSLECAYHQD